MKVAVFEAIVDGYEEKRKGLGHENSDIKKSSHCNYPMVVKLHLIEMSFSGLGTWTPRGPDDVYDISRGIRQHRACTPT